MEETLDLLKSDFKVFLYAVWHQLNLPEPTRAQLCIADYLQHGPQRAQIQAFRGVGKSWISDAFILWLLFNDPELKILVISASKERADNHSIFMQKLLVETSWLNHLIPANRDNARWSRVSFDVECSPHQAPSVKSVGITGQITGSRADFILLDDVEVPGNSMTELMREKLLQLCTESESVLTPKENSRIVYLGTPQTTFTVYRKLAERGYKPFVWPARYPRNQAQYEGKLAPQLVEDLEKGAKAWDPTDPNRFNNEELLKREASMGRSNFMLQFMLDTSLSDAEKFPLKFADLIITSVNPEKAPDSLVWCSDPRNNLKDLPAVGLPGDYFYGPMVIQGEWSDYSEVICFIDPSGRGKDETAAVYMGQKNGFLFVPEVRAYRDGYSDATLLDVLRGCRKYKVTTLVIESNFGDGMISELFRKHMKETKQNIGILEERASIAKKEDRIIDSLEPVMNQHRLVMDRRVVEWDYGSNQDLPPEERLTYMLFYQMSRMCREKGAVKHDDRLDALAGAVAYFTKSLSLSANQAMIDRRREDFEDLVLSFQEDPQTATDHLALGFDLDMRRKARGMPGRQQHTVIKVSGHP